MICTVVGARPNFVKMAPVIHELNRRGVPQYFVHTGQHYDAQMSTVFADELQLPTPDLYLNVGSGSHAEQTARVMVAFEQACRAHRPELVVVGGDVNSTLACALAAAKLEIPVAHLEAGLRSFDRSMPEEINRVLADHLSELLLTTEPSAEANLRKEGIDAGRIHFVGNCMIDSLAVHVTAALARQPWHELALEPGGYALLTLHRPAAVDDGARLDDIRRAVQAIATVLPVVFPVHPRTRGRIDASGRDWRPVRLVDPLGYLDFLGLMARARLVLTDSGGVQEETTALGVTCLTLRANTERPVTIDVGTNTLCGTTSAGIVDAARLALASPRRDARIPEKWDGRAATRAVDVIETWHAEHASPAAATSV